MTTQQRAIIQPSNPNQSPQAASRTVLAFLETSGAKPEDLLRPVDGRLKDQVLQLFHASGAKPESLADSSAAPAVAQSAEPRE